MDKNIIFSFSFYIEVEFTDGDMTVFCQTHNDCTKLKIFTEEGLLEVRNGAAEAIAKCFGKTVLSSKYITQSDYIKYQEALAKAGSTLTSISSINKQHKNKKSKGN